MTFRRPSRFTLIEVVAVIAVMVIAAGFAVAGFRTDSPARKLDSAANDFGLFCARVRFQAMENGSERIVLFNPAAMTFSVRLPDELVQKDDDGQTVETEETKAAARLSWKTPDKFTLGNTTFEDDELDSDGNAEMFRFFSDGSAGGKRAFELHYGTLGESFEISPLTGLLNRKEISGGNTP